MHQIDNPWAITAKPLAQPVGNPGWFQKGEPPDLLATIVDYDWANTVQAEILNVVLGAGLTPDKQNDSQLLLAIQTMIEGVTGVDLSLFVLRAGDTMTGPLITPKLTSNTGRIISEVSGQPSITLFDTATSKGGGVWLDSAGVLYFGAADGTGTPTASWLTADGAGLHSAFGLTAATSIRSTGGRIIAQGSSYPSVTVYDTTRGVAWGMWSDQNSYLGWGTADGNGGAVQQVMWLTSAGQLHLNSIVASGAIQAAQLGATGNINGAQIMASGAIYASYPLAPSFYLNGDGTNNVLNFQAGYAFVWSTSSGMLTYVANSANAMTIDYAGNMVLTGNITVAGAVAFTQNGSQGNLYCTGDAGAFRMVGAYPYFHQLGVRSYGNLLSYNTPAFPDGGGAWDCDVNGTTDQRGYAYNLANPNPSDATLKSNIQPWTPGLAEVLQINTVSFEFTPEARFGVPPGTRHHGVNAQDVQAVMPEAIHIMRRHLNDNDPPTEVLAVNASVIFYACLNAIKEIAGRLDVLEGARA